MTAPKSMPGLLYLDALDATAAPAVADRLERADRAGRVDRADAAARAETAETVEECVTRLFEQLRDPVYRYLVSGYCRPTDAEEITQDVFLRLYAALTDGDVIQHPRAWAFRVAHNLAVNHVRREPPTADVDDITWSTLCATRPDEAPTPEQRLLQDERRGWIRARAATLSELQRRCLLLRVEGFRYREIAAILDVSVSTVAESIRRGIRRLSRDGERAVGAGAPAREAATAAGGGAATGGTDGATSAPARAATTGGGDHA